LVGQHLVRLHLVLNAPTTFDQQAVQRTREPVTCCALLGPATCSLVGEARTRGVLGLHPSALSEIGTSRRREIADYQANGIEIVGIVGVGASPSCGVVTTVDVAAALGPWSGALSTS
jgi:hypothetical protein